MISTLPPFSGFSDSEQTEKPMLLVVDDQRINIELLNDIFRDAYEICIATNGEDALEFCQTRLPDLILLDIVMPGLSGHEVCHRLKQNPITRNIPVIFITARDNLADEVQGLEEGAVDFIAKPLVPQIVRARVLTHLTLKRQSYLLRSMAFIDGLTGIANRRRFDEALATEWRYCMRSALPLSLIMIDIDFFKSYNDHYGHQAGDECLRLTAAALSGQMGRAHDLVARYGGEEFACILPNTSLDGAYKKAEELRETIHKLALPNVGSKVADIITISLGVAAAMPARGNEPDSLLAAADNLLYAAKQAGRNQIAAERY